MPTKQKPISPPTDIEGEIKKHGEIINWLSILMTAVVIVLFIGFITMLVGFLTLIWSAHLFGQNTYQGMVNEIEQQNDKLDTILQRMITPTPSPTTTTTNL